MVFGPHVSASSWEHFCCAIKAMMGHFLLRTDFVSQYDDYLKMISFKDPAPVGTIFVHAPKYNLNFGILDKQGNQCPIPTFVFMDNCLLVVVCQYMRNILCRSIHAIFVILEFSDVAL